MKLGNDLYSKVTPLVDLPSYTQYDIKNKHEDLKSNHKNAVAAWFKKEYIFYVLMAITLGFISIYLSFHYLLPNLDLSDPQISAIANELNNYHNSLYLFYLAFALIIPLPLCPIPKFWKIPREDQAEFELRVELCRPQLNGASDEKVRQIWAYCNSSLDEPIEL